jgi:hypothetical protein
MQAFVPERHTLVYRAMVGASSTMNKVGDYLDVQPMHTKHVRHHLETILRSPILQKRAWRTSRKSSWHELTNDKKVHLKSNTL